jgi:CRISPR-associated protein Cas2
VRYVVAAYDIRDDARRARMAKTLKNVLDRVQKSVFEGEVPEESWERAEERALRHLNKREDSLRIYFLCARCVENIRSYGVSIAILEDPEIFVV